MSVEVEYIHVPDSADECRRMWRLMFAAHNTHRHEDILPLAEKAEKYLNPPRGQLSTIKKDPNQ